MISFKSFNESNPLVEAKDKDEREYGYEGDMAMSQLKSIMNHSKQLLDMLEPNTDLPEWVQSKITLAADYIQTAADYMSTEMNEEVAAWQRKEGKNPAGGLNRKGIASYRRENPGSKLSMAVTTKPSKLKKGSKSANRRKSFCARMGGMKKRLTSAKTANDPNSRINKALRKWNC